MMRYFLKISVLILSISAFSCQDTKDDYYNADTEESVNSTVLELIDQNPEFSTFVSLFRKYKLDTVFSQDKSITLFMPDNKAFEQSYELFLDTLDVLRYYIIDTYINASNITGESVVQTIGKKYVTISNTGTSILYDNALVSYESPLCNDGKCYGISNVVQPKPNLYEYISLTNEFYKTFIDEQDTTYLDPNSTPIGYDDEGNTIYDTLWIAENTFEKNYFPVSEELRDDRATLLLFSGEDMEAALEEVKTNLGLPTVEDIPSVWINTIMMPAITNGSVFSRELQLTDFAKGTVKNINGDSVKVNLNDISSTSFQCSNGLAYSYTNFRIPENLYYGTDTIFGKNIVVKKNLTEYTWGSDVMVSGAPFIPSPDVEYIQKIDQDVISVSLKETETFELTTTFSNMFPNTYLLICNVKSDPSAKFKIYANDELLDVTIKRGFAYGGTTTKDYIDIYDLRNQGSEQSPNTLKYISDIKYSSVAGYRTFEVLINNITEYGDVNIKLQYDGKSAENEDNPGLILNYMTLESWNE